MPAYGAFGAAGGAGGVGFGVGGGGFAFGGGAGLFGGYSYPAFGGYAPFAFVPPKVPPKKKEYGVDYI